MLFAQGATLVPSHLPSSPTNQIGPRVRVIARVWSFVLAVLLGLVQSVSLHAAPHQGQRTLQDFGVQMDRGRIAYPLPSTVSLGLFNPDPLLDIAVIEDGKMKVYQNMGNGRFTYGPVWERQVNGTVEKMQWRKSRMLGQVLSDPESWGDLHIRYKDGRTELISHEQMLNKSVEMYFPQEIPMNTPPLSFHEVWRSERNGMPVAGAVVGDFDRDGRMNIEYAFRDSDPHVQAMRLVVYESVGNDQYVVEWDTVFQNGFNGPLCMSDIDNDGHNELVIVRDPGVALLECYGPRQYRYYTTNIAFSSGGRPNQAIFKIQETDIDHNGIKELTVLNSDPSVSYDKTFIYISEYVTKGPCWVGCVGWNMAFSGQLARDQQSYDFDMAVGQVDGVGWDEIVPGDGGFGVGESIPIAYLWYNGTPGPFAWEVRGINTGLSSGSTAPMFVNLDADSSKELVIGGVGPIYHGSMFSLKYMHDTTWSVMWADSSLICSPLHVNSGSLNGQFVVAGANIWDLSPLDTFYSELHAYEPAGSHVGTWRKDSSGIQSFELLDVDHDGRTNLVFASIASYRHYLEDFESDSTTLGVVTKGDLPALYQLYQNYPNPFNPQTSITFKLPQQAIVKLVIFDILGKEVKTLINEELAPGSHAVHWNGKTNQGGDASSGVYFYRLTATGGNGILHTEARKMLMIR